MNRPRNSAVIPLRCCIKCRSTDVVATYEEDRRYKYLCMECGQYFEFNARSQLEADEMWNTMFVR